MGAWGPGVFSDDTACDVRNQYRDWIAEGHSPLEVKDAILRDWGDSVNDVDAGHVIWLALAVTQWRLGRLDEDTRDRALAVIDSGAALQPWAHDKRLLKARQTVLSRERIRLQSQQPLPRKLKKRFVNTCDWALGELIGYRLLSGKLVIFRVIAHHSDLGGTSPIVEVLDWTGAELPDIEELKTMGMRLGKFIAADKVFANHYISQLFIGRLSERELPTHRVNRLGITLDPAQQRGWVGGALWKTLDIHLVDIFGIE